MFLPPQRVFLLKNATTYLLCSSNQRWWFVATPFSQLSWIFFVFFLKLQSRCVCFFFKLISIGSRFVITQRHCTLSDSDWFVCQAVDCSTFPHQFNCLALLTTVYVTLCQFQLSSFFCFVSLVRTKALWRCLHVCHSDGESLWFHNYCVVDRVPDGRWNVVICWPTNYLKLSIAAQLSPVGASRHRPHIMAEMRFETLAFLLSAGRHVSGTLTTDEPRFTCYSAKFWHEADIKTCLTAFFSCRREKSGRRYWGGRIWVCGVWVFGIR